MLTQSEIAGIRDLCAHLDPDVIASVAATATKGKLSLTTTDEAVGALVLHSESALWLLNRKKLTRNLLFEYLNAKKIPVTGKAEKIDVITKILEYWSSRPFGNDAVVREPACVGTYPQRKTPREAEVDVHPQRTTAPLRAEEAVVLNGKPHMGLEFAKWFYEILLALHKQSIPQEQVANQFWDDVRLRIFFNSYNCVNTQEAMGNQEAALLLAELVCRHACLLNPNITDEGVQEKTSAHGPVMIAVCGTVHQNGNCTGIFEQAFGLLQDPASDFSWRIKWSDLRVTQAAVAQTPRISDLPGLMAICDGSAS